MRYSIWIILSVFIPVISLAESNLQASNYKTVSFNRADDRANVPAKETYEGLTRGSFDTETMSEVSPGYNLVPDRDIEYNISTFDTSMPVSTHGKTVYKDWENGTFDKEEMIVILPRDIAENLPEPLIIPYLEEVQTAVRSNKFISKEDNVYSEISQSEQLARCVLLGEKCEELFEPERRNSIYYRPILEQQKERKVISP